MKNMTPRKERRWIQVGKLRARFLTIHPSKSTASAPSSDQPIEWELTPRTVFSHPCRPVLTLSTLPLAQLSAQSQIPPHIPTQNDSQHDQPADDDLEIDQLEPSGNEDEEQVAQANHTKSRKNNGCSTSQVFLIPYPHLYLYLSPANLQDLKDRVEKLMTSHPGVIRLSVDRLIEAAIEYREGSNTISSTNDGCQRLFNLYRVPSKQDISANLDGKGIPYTDWSALKAFCKDADRKVSSEDKLKALSQVQFLFPLLATESC